MEDYDIDMFVCDLKVSWLRMEVHYPGSLHILVEGEGGIPRLIDDMDGSHNIEEVKENIEEHIYVMAAEFELYKVGHGMKLEKGTLRMYNSPMKPEDKANWLRLVMVETKPLRLKIKKGVVTPDVIVSMTAEELAAATAHASAKLVKWSQQVKMYTTHAR